MMKIPLTMEKIITREKLNTKVLVYTRREEVKTNLNLGNHKLEEVKEFCYLGIRVTSDGRRKKEIVSRIVQAKRAYLRKANLLTAENISVKVRKDADSIGEIKVRSLRNVVL